MNQYSTNPDTAGYVEHCPCGDFQRKPEEVGKAVTWFCDIHGRVTLDASMDLTDEQFAKFKEQR